MGKKYSRILIATLIFVIIAGLCYFGGICTMGDNLLSEINSSVKEDYDAAWENDEIDDVEGFGLIFEGAFAGLANFAGMLVVVVFCIGIPLYAFGGMILLQVIARLFQCGENKKWKNTISIVLTVINLIFQIGTFIGYVYCGLMFNFSLVIILLILGINASYTYFVIKELRKHSLNEIVVVSEENKI
ncbi:MAG: hypothetical protein J6J60_09275 [Clostridia bacterium]|nr:hypothetical protein [Clostridia bacterium]